MRIFILNFLMGFFSSEFLSRSFFSSDDTEFIRRFPAETITHGFSRMRPVRSLQIPPESGKCPTDFTDLHRFFLGRFFCHADFADDADFFHRDFIHWTTRNLFGEFLLWRLLTDFRRCDLSGRCRYPLRLEKVPQISQIYTDFSWDVFFVTQISQMTQIFFIGILFIGRHGISRMRPVRSLQIPPEVGQRDSPEIP